MTTATAEKKVSLSVNSGGALAISEGDTYTVRSLEMRTLDINSFMSVLRRALPSGFMADNSNGEVRVKGPKKFFFTFKVRIEKEHLIGYIERHIQNHAFGNSNATKVSLLFEYPIGPINAINLLKKIFWAAMKAPSRYMLFELLKPIVPGLTAVSNLSNRRDISGIIYGLHFRPETVMDTLNDGDDDDREFDYLGDENVYAITIKDGKAEFLGEFRQGDGGGWRETHTESIQNLQYKVEVLNERIARAEKIKALVHDVPVALFFDPQDLAN